MNSIVRLSIGYFLSYIATGLAIKIFTGKVEAGFFGLNSIEYLVYSTLFSSLFCVAVVLVLKWHQRAHLTRAEKLSLFFSGACTAYIIPTSTLIMSLPISVMVAMVLMRGSVIVASRSVDFLLNRSRTEKKSIPWQEEVAVLLSIAAIMVKLFFSHEKGAEFPTLGVVLLGLYFLAYLARLYIMNRAKLAGLGGNKRLDQKLYFGTEQLFASSFLGFVTIPLFFVLRTLPENGGTIGAQFVASIDQPSAHWHSAALSGLPYSFIAFLSVFLFLFPGKTATFTGVLNRLVSLLGGTASSLILYRFFSGKFPPPEDWFALGFILLAIIFLAWGDHAEQVHERNTHHP